MRFVIPILLLLCFVGQVCSQDPYLDIANELLVRKKLSAKLPDVFDNAKYMEVTNKLDNIAQLNLKTHENRLAVNNPEFHWCYAQTYILVGKSSESLDHYRRYKIHTLGSTSSIHPLFQKPLIELETALENQQANLAHEIYLTINNFKNSNTIPRINQILDLQSKLNTYNELSITPKMILTDGIIGLQTKSAIYDFEENNPYYIKKGEIENSQVTSLEISSIPSTIRPVSTTITDFVDLPDFANLSINNTASDLPINKSFDLSTTIIIDEDKIKSTPGNTIAEVLENVSGINIKRRGISDAHANVSIFGGTGEQTLILIDGLKISNQQTLHHDLDLPINIDDIKQIEVSRNAAAREYGTGAISGVINIITKNGNEQKSYIAAEYGDYAFLNGNLAVNVPIGKSFHNISFSELNSTGYQENTDFLKRTFYYKYAIKDGRSSTNFSFGYLARGNGVTNHLSNNFANQYENNLTKFFNSKILWDFDNIKLESNMHWFDHQDELAKDKDTGGWDKYSNTEIGVNFNSNINWSWGTSRPGFTYNRETNSNTNLKEIKRDHYSLSLQHDISINKLNINLGMSGNYYNDLGWFAAPGYQLVYNINKNANIYHKYDYGFRLPSFYEMHATDYIYSGNENLEGESINSFEYGMQLYGTAMTITISQFYKNNQNVIDWYQSSISGFTKWNATNITDVLTSGHNMRVELFPSIIKRLSFIDRLEIGYAHLDIEHNGEENEYKNLTHYLKHQMTFGMQYNLPFNISQSWFARYEQPATFDNRTIVDTQIHYQIWHIETTLNIINILDLTYEDIQDVTLPGRWIRFSLRYNL